MFVFTDVLSAFVVLFAVIDVPGLIPILIDNKKAGRPVDGLRAALYSLCAFVAFLFMGEAILALFHVDITSFAIAGALVIFVVGFEMIFGVKIFKFDGPPSSSVFVPIVFPLIAGAGSFTTLISLRALYGLPDILAALVANVVVIYVVIRYVSFFEKVLGEGGIYVFRKFFGIILLAISVRIFMDNFLTIFKSLLHS